MNSTLKFGLLAGGITAILMGISWPLMQNGTLTYSTAEITGYISMLLALSLIFFGIRDRKMRELGGKITFKEALITGVLIALICSVIYTTTWMTLTSLYPELSEKLMQMYLESEQAKNRSAHELAEVQKMIENYKNPLFKAGMTMLEIFPLAFVVTLVSAFILKSKKAS